MPKKQIDTPLRRIEVPVKYEEQNKNNDCSEFVPSSWFKLSTYLKSLWK